MSVYVCVYVGWGAGCRWWRGKWDTLWLHVANSLHNNLSSRYYYLHALFCSNLYWRIPLLSVVSYPASFKGIRDWFRYARTKYVLMLCKRIISHHELTITFFPPAFHTLLLFASLWLGDRPPVSVKWCLKTRSFICDVSNASACFACSWHRMWPGCRSHSFLSVDHQWFSRYLWSCVILYHNVRL